MSPQARMAAGNAPPGAGVSTSDNAGVGPFVINLTSSTSPMALSHPDAPELKRFSFFVSRRREDNRERFRLHMGYFATLAEAEEWLNIIRDLYPGAWAGEAPGKKLRARAAEADAANPLTAPPSAAATRAPSAPAPAAQTAAVARRAAAPAAAPIQVPTLQAAPTLPPAPQAALPASAAPMLEAVAQAAAALAAVAKTAMAQSAAQVTTSFMAPPPAADYTVLAPSPFVPAPVHQAASAQPVFTPAPPAPVAAPQPPRMPARLAAAASAAIPPKGMKKNPQSFDGSNVREVMASLDETGETRRMQIPAGLRAPAPAPRAAASAAASVVPAAAGAMAAPASASAATTTSAATTARAAGAGAGRVATAPAYNAAANASTNVAQSRTQNAAANARTPAAPATEMPRAAARPPRAPLVESPAPDLISDTQVLRMLETRRADENEKGSDDANVGISLLKPDDTQTRRALKEAVLDNAPVAFAVQLQWSVQPVALDKVPPLAIFSAYTLYTVEGSREGRKWYGLRLGFFSDAISAKQVAYYVRSEFTSVAVVPVSPAEKSRASDEETRAATGAFQRKHVEQKIEEFKLFDDSAAAAAATPAPKAAVPPKAAAPAARASARKNKPLGRVRAKEQRSPKTLEETLEILGASELEIDSGRELLNDTGVRHLRVEVQKETPFAKLLDRISERVRRN